MLRNLTFVTCPDTGTVYPIPAGAEDPTPTPEPDPPADPEPDPEPKKPWGSDDDFDPDKAWRLIENLRSDIDRLKPQAARAKELEDAQKTEQQRLAEARDAEKQRADTAEAQAARLEAAIRHGLSEEDLDLLDGVPADKVEQRARRLAERLAQNIADPQPPPPSSRRQGGGTEPPAASVAAGRDIYQRRHTNQKGTS
jgi:hypothetical protein